MILKHLIVGAVTLVLTVGGSPLILSAQESADQAQKTQNKQEGKPGVLVVERTSKSIIIPKDPLVGAFLSFSIPGLGQVYSKRYLRGVFFLGAETICFLTAAGTLSYFGDYEYEVDDTDGNTHKLSANDSNSLDNGAKALLISSALIGIGLHIWNIIDGYHQAEEYNRKNFQISQASPSLSFGMGPGGRGFMLSMSKTFPSP